LPLTLNPNLETRNLKPESRNPKPETPGSFATYLGAFVGGIRMKEGDKNTVTVTSDQWLVWKYEGDCTLESYLAPPNDRDFPYNIEYAVLKKYNDNMEDGKRQTLIIKNIIWPILAALRDMHRVGIVHRSLTD
jgi:hypothetical protein